MDDQNQNKMFMPTQGEDTSTQPPRFHRPHISQEPINDPEPEYVTRNRYQTLEMPKRDVNIWASPRETLYI